MRGVAWATVIGAGLALVLGQDAPAQTATSTETFEGPARFSVQGTALVYNTANPGAFDREDSIVYDDVDQLREMLRAHPEVTEVQLNSEGGGYFAGFDMARIIQDFELDTVVRDECSSSCTYVFLGGAGRRMMRGARIGFHHTSWGAANIESFYGDRAEANGWDTAFDFASWVYEDTQTEVYDRLSFMVNRGVDATFAIETLRAGTDDMWYPPRSVLLAAGFLSE
ncbi:MAG: hypothetical protein AAFO58_02980 [Pseudomonadota bacterium]